jgi:hypothetical protein
MVAQVAAADLILTTIGRVAVRPLAGYLAKNGGKKFAQQYGPKAFEAVLGTTVGLKAYKETEEYLSEYLNHIDEGGEEGSFVPKGSMPDTDRMKQMDSMMAVPNVNPNINRSIRGTPAGLVIGDTGQKEKERERIAAEEKERMKGAPAPKVETGWKESFPDQSGELIDSSLPPSTPEPIELPQESFPDLSDELNKPQTLYNKDDSEFKYPTTEELKNSIKEENKFWEEEVIPEANEKRPQLNIKNLPKIVEADKHFGAAAMSFSNFSESQLIYMSPQEYLDLTKRFRPVGTQGEGSKLNSDNIEQLLKDGKELANIPFLNVTKVGDSYEVTGQEGIHRAIAFKNLGYDKMPVVIEGTGKDKVAGVENKVYTATPKSYLYTEDWAKDYIGFIPKSIQSDGEVLLTNPGDFYNVRTKEKLFVKDDISEQTDKLVRGIGDNNPPSSIEEEPTESKSLTTQNFLNDDLMNDLLTIRGGIEGFKKNMASEFPKMPASTKNFMEQELQKKLFDKYKLDKYPEGESPETVNEFRKKYLEDTYFKNLGAIEYITSVAYDVIDEKPKDSILVVDEDGLPIAAAKISLPGKKDMINVSDMYHKDALVIVEAGSIFKNAGDQLFNDIIQKAKDEGRRFVIAEDLTSPEALEAMKKRGFRTTTTKDTKKFKGQKIRRPNGRSAVQKNLVLDLSKEIIKEQTDNLLKKK